MKYRVAVVGSTGVVGQEMLRILEQRRFPVGELVPLASERSAGKRVRFAGRDHEVQTLDEESFEGVQLALFSAGGSVSQSFAPAAAAAGAMVVDNSSAFRMDPEIPLVVPEINPGKISSAGDRRIIANPNCSTIQMVVVLGPLHRAAGLRRIVVSTYQAVSGAGRRAVEELERQRRARTAGDPVPAPDVLPHRIDGECLPQIGEFGEDGYTVEERKMIEETRKILDLPSLRITATTVRVPVFVGHSESVNVETSRPIEASEAIRILSESPGVEVIDSPGDGRYPLASRCEGQDAVQVGRIRKDRSVDHGLNLWVVADNLRKGAALNAVQISELLAAGGLLRI